MSARELQDWALFERRFGPLTVQERVDAAGAIAAWAAAAAIGGSQASPEQFLPDWAGEREERPEQDPADMIATMRGIQARTRGKLDHDST